MIFKPGPIKAPLIKAIALCALSVATVIFYIGYQKTDIPADASAKNRLNITLTGTKISYSIPTNLIRVIDRTPDDREVTHGLLIGVLPNVDGKDKSNSEKFKTVSDIIIIGFQSISENNSTVEDGENSKLSHWPNLPRIDRGVRYGLSVQHEVPPYAAYSRRREIYSMKKGDALSLSIVCQVDGSYPHPGCTMVFQIDGALVTATFDRMHLENWNHIHSRIVLTFSEWKIRAVTDRKTVQFVQRMAAEGTP